MKRVAVWSTVVYVGYNLYLFSGYANGFATWRLLLGILIGAIFGWSWTSYIIVTRRRQRLIREWDEFIQTTFPPRRDEET